MIRLVAITTATGSVAIMQLVVKDRRTIDLEKEAAVANMPLESYLVQAVELEIAKLEEAWQHPTQGSPDLLPIQTWRFIEEVPRNRIFRNAWVDSGKTIEHDMPKAREIYRQCVRDKRAPLLRELDVSYQRADEAEDRDTKRLIAAQKQALRDAPGDPRIEAANSVEELLTIDLPARVTLK